MAAVEIFKSHDLVFSDRKCPDMLIALIYHQGSLAVIPYGVSCHHPSPPFPSLTLSLPLLPGQPDTALLLTNAALVPDQDDCDDPCFLLLLSLFPGPRQRVAVPQSGTHHGRAILGRELLDH
ncbi:hypothetical protein NL676_002048 [Syzygium grande]|nr:hypothetical protein NL676_002048 [Syzygium grande]